jgi:hypothetical protein
LKTVLIISYSPLHRDPRILRQVQALKQDYKIATIGYTRINEDSIIYYPVKIPVKLSFGNKICLLFSFFFNYKVYEKNSLERVLDLQNILFQNIVTPDVIIANDWNGLYLASTLKSKYSWQAKIYFDAHEYSPKEFDNSIRWCLLIRPIIINVLKKCKTDINIMSAVCESVAREYERFFNFPDGFVRVVTNAAEYNSTLKPTEIGGGGGKIRLIHHGGAMKVRRLELMIKMMKYLDPERYDLTFMLVPSDKTYYKYLINLAEKYNNIHFIDPVDFSEITKILNGYDIGIFLLLPEIFNYKYALPNKLFEYVQARLAIAIGPSIEMVKIVEQYNLGVYSDDFSPKSFANRIAQLTAEEILEYKKNADKHARELSAEENIVNIRRMLKEIEI